MQTENEKLKLQLGDMIDKYKILYAKIRELQEERKLTKEKEAEKARADGSINPFSLASQTFENSRTKEKEDILEEQE